MKELEKALTDIIEDGFAEYLTERGRRCKLLTHGLEVIEQGRSIDYPHIVVDATGDRIVRSIAGNPAIGQYRIGGIDINIAVLRKGDYKTAKIEVENLMIDFVNYLQTKVEKLYEEGFADLRYRDEADNWAIYIGSIGGNEVLIGRLLMEAEYEWSEGIVLKNKNYTLRTT